MKEGQDATSTGRWRALQVERQRIAAACLPMDSESYLAASRSGMTQQVQTPAPEDGAPAPAPKLQPQSQLNYAAPAHAHPPFCVGQPLPALVQHQVKFRITLSMRPATVSFFKHALVDHFISMAPHLQQSSSLVVEFSAGP